MKQTFSEQYGLSRNKAGIGKSYQGEIELIFIDTKSGRECGRHSEGNLVKIFAKEMLAHRLPHSRVWDPEANTDSGAWVSSGIDVEEELSAKYILFGASFDDDGAPLDTTDERYYTLDAATGTYVPIRLGPGAEYGGGLVNAVPLAEPDRPLKKIERIYFEPTYQPAGTPLLQDDVRAMNNIVVLETTLRKEEYNGFGLTNSDYFTISEVALAGGKELDTIGSCECIPRDLFLEGKTSGEAITANANGTSTVTITDPSFVDVIGEGDQVKIVDANSTAQDESSLDQVTPYYLVVSKEVGGSDVVLDRAVVDADGNSISGEVGLFRTSLRIFSHRILATPFRKSVDMEIIVRWRIILN